MPDDQPDIPADYADTVAALTDTNSGTVMPPRPMMWAEARGGVAGGMAKQENDMTTKPPNMTPEERAGLNSALLRTTHYLEWGMGASTCDAACHPNIESIVSVDSDPAWVAKMRVDIILGGERARLIHADIGPVGAWGYPAEGVSGVPYVLAPWGGPEPDLVLIDGRFRVACALFVSLAAPRATVLLHDADRDEYRVLREFFDVAAKVGTLWELLPRDRPLAAMTEMLGRLEDAR